MVYTYILLLTTTNTTTNTTNEFTTVINFIHLQPSEDYLNRWILVVLVAQLYHRTFLSPRMVYTYILLLTELLVLLFINLNRFC